jgi:hypothetical protein
MAKKKSGAHNPTTVGGPDSVRGNLAGLIDQVKSSNALLESGDAYAMTQTYALQNINNVIIDVAADVRSIATLMTGDRLKDKETISEQNKRWDDILQAIKDGNKPKTGGDKKGDFSWLGLAAALVSGLVAGGMAFIANYVKGLQAFWTAMSKALKIDGYIVALFNKIKTGFVYIEELLSGGFMKALNWIKGLFSEMKWLKTVEQWFASIGKYVSKIFNLGQIGEDFAVLWKNIQGVWEMMGKPLKWIGEIFGGGGGGIMRYFDDLLMFFKPLTGMLKSMGAILGKLAMPIQVIMSIFDTVTGAMDGWNKTQGTWFDKLMGAIKGGLSGLLNGLIGGLLDLLKDGLSFVLDFFGFQDAAAWLDSFSFSDIITKGISNIVDGIVGFFKDMINGPLMMFNALKDAMNGKIDWTTFAKQAIAGLLTAILAPVNMLSKFAGFDLTKKALEMLGLNDAGGGGGGQAAAPAATPAPAPAPSTPTASPSAPVIVAKDVQVPKQETLQEAQDRLNKAQADGEMSKADANVEKMKLGLRPSFGRANQNANTNMSAPAVPISSSTTRWDPEDAMARGN